jgi:hypothetical protein
MDIGPISAIRLVPTVRPTPRTGPDAHVKVEYTGRTEDENDSPEQQQRSSRGIEDEIGDEEESELADDISADSVASEDSGSVGEPKTVSFFA